MGRKSPAVIIFSKESHILKYLELGCQHINLTEIIQPIILFFWESTLIYLIWSNRSPRLLFSPLGNNFNWYISKVTNSFLMTFPLDIRYFFHISDLHIFIILVSLLLLLFLSSLVGFLYFQPFKVKRSLVGYSPWGHKTVGHDSVTKQEQQIDIYIYTSSFQILLCEYHHLS